MYSSVLSVQAPYPPFAASISPVYPLFSFSGQSVLEAPHKPLSYSTQLSLCLYLKNRDTSLLVLIVLIVLLSPITPAGLPLVTLVPLLFFGTASLSLFFLLQTSLLLLSLFVVWKTLLVRELEKQEHQRLLL